MIIGQDILKTSWVIMLPGRAYKKCRLFYLWLSGICGDSFSYTRIKAVFKAVAAIFQYSFLGRMGEIVENIDIAEAARVSITAKKLSEACGSCIKRIAGYSKTSFTVNYAIGFAVELRVLSSTSLFLSVLNNYKQPVLEEE
jgi:hypothetical protein